MQKIFHSLIVLCLFSVTTLVAQSRMLPADSVVITKHKTTIKGQAINYTAECGTQPVWNDDGKVTASLFYTYYTRDGIADRTARPLVISFNGGPGSASVWMHLAYTGPVILEVDDEGFPVQPYGVKSNPNSILDVADIVYVNPVNTGYSRILDKETKKETFFGVNQDIEYLAEWINTFITRHNRWLSPKYLIGESYGTTRVSGLALALQNNQWMYLNGVILVSPTDLGIDRDGPVKAANRLPYFAAAAWFHKKLAPELQRKDLDDLLAEVEAYTVDEYLPTLAKGGFIEPAERAAMAKKVAAYSGLNEEAVLQNNLDISTSFFWKELLRNEGFTVGRLDSRYTGIDRKVAGDRPDFNSELTSWLHSFTPAINYYLQEVLKFKTEVKYNMFGPVRPWDRSGDQTGENLRQAMAQNPYLNVLVQSGYYDGATNYFDAKYSMWQLDPSGRMKDRLSFKGYRSGHMMYLRAEDLATSNEHLREFIKASTPTKGEPAMYIRP
ncbi:S10 family peptidase [Flavilitoribacter nigricans]|uniref:Carboxypeptidase n=1 Tax=Flavilitoribacter nigricans (strain ATCC 23147 / DSM 23189 / NBRC 102662 / NCIMB 1420 / SS-2) TaxID=1122177 RepID=A0A2D0NIB8_FLAN2|nr:carboxypeptidase [Flavilitoribacter nigricans]PHN08116.1 carboxypeptidase [Flavilitoribacter nigricans DSM 23189 = NBRC 102662]